MTNNLKIFNNSLFNYTKLILVSLFGLFITRILLKSLGVSDYGLYNVVGGVVVLMAYLNTVMITASFRFIAYEQGKNNIAGVNLVFNISLVLHLVIAILVITVGETFGVVYIRDYLVVPLEMTEIAIKVFRISLYTLIFTILSVPFQALLTANENFKWLSIIEVLRYFFRLLAALVILNSKMNMLITYTWLLFFVNFIIMSFYIFFCIRNYYAAIKIKLYKDWKKYKEMLSFTGWNTFGAAAQIGKIQGSDLLLNFFYGTVLNASYGIAKQVNTIITMFAGGIGQAAIPQITKSYSRGEESRTLELVSHISKYTFFLMLLPIIPILLGTDLLLKLWLEDVPEYTQIIIKLLIVNSLIESLAAGIPAAINATGKNKIYQIVMGSLSLLCLPFAFIAFKMGAQPYSIFIIYIIMATFATVIRQILLKYYFNFDVKYFMKIAYFRVSLVLLFLLPLYFFRDYFNKDFISFTIATFLELSYFLLVIFFIGLENYERKSILIKLKALIN